MSPSASASAGARSEGSAQGTHVHAAPWSQKGAATRAEFVSSGSRRRAGSSGTEGGAGGLGSYIEGRASIARELDPVQAEGGARARDDEMTR